MPNNYERLTSLDASFLALETRTTHMHVAGVSIFDAKNLHQKDGGLDIDRIRAFINSRLQYVPRYRQRIAWVPLERAPIWVDDEHFNIDFHVRHTSLPKPGTDEQLKKMAGRILSQQLDRAKPLWEMWIIEGLEGDRMAMVTKIHHCMVDGVASTGIMGALLNVVPTSEIEESAGWAPTPPPNGVEIMAGELNRRLKQNASRMADARMALADTQAYAFNAARKARASWYSLTSGWLSPAPITPLNGQIGPNRRYDWVEIGLDRIKSVRKDVGGTVNDIVLATMAGAIRSLFLNHPEVEDLDMEFRVLAPVSVRTGKASELGNQVAMWLVPLPLADPDPLSRLSSIKIKTEHLKNTEQALGASTLVSASSGAPHQLVSLGARLATGVRPFNMTVTNVPGPQFPMYLLDAELLHQYPVVPLWHGHGVGVALFSYNGQVAWGINADWDIVPDTAAFGQAILDSFEELTDAAKQEAAIS
ncbi:MAG TPA: wax ester/triacylglycerol synthase family O-acyltransferase [Actinobacteria bacterium]|nr:wax ester/triacylglycerol synthase family O-acyltransferase [Actinomycetota bacterium]